MSGAAIGAWPVIGLIAYWTGAVTAVAAAVWLAPRRSRLGPASTATLAALCLTASWCVAVVSTSAEGITAGIAESARNLALLWVVYRLFASDGRHASLAPIRPLVLALAFVALLRLVVMAMAVQLTLSPAAELMVFDISVTFRMLVIVGGLVLLHNLYGGASNTARLALRWPAAGLAILWGFDLNLYAIAYIGEAWPAELGALRGFAAAILAILFAIGGGKGRDALHFSPSRAVAFQSLSLLLIGAYLTVMFAVAQAFAMLGGDFAQVLGNGFLIAATALAVLVLPSARLRGWLRVFLTKHLFQHRYDYRAEWLRFNRTVGGAFKSSDASALPLQQRVVQALADITDSPAGLLLSPDEHGELTLAGRWQWATVEVPATGLDAKAVTFLERHGFIIDLDDVRAGRDQRGEQGIVPAWLREETRAWALVPLLHFDRLVGAVVLARAPSGRALDWEDFDLLRVAGQQLASYLAEYAGQQALAEANRFDEFHRRIAFVMHDIKNLASQLGLLARNAELHVEKPEFRADMLVTLRNAADKLNTLLARLSRYGGSVDQLETVDAARVAGAVVTRHRAGRQVILNKLSECRVRASPESLEQVLDHLVRNALEASDEASAVFISVASDGLHGLIEIVDSGQGMSPEFVRSRLFKPFDSTKSGGFGLGAFEARELVRAMGGRLEVESREGLGTRFIVRLPLAAASDLFSSFKTSDREVA
jgi:putative PEP-CTERM system histidine kinase